MRMVLPSANALTVLRPTARLYSHPLLSLKNGRDPEIPNQLIRALRVRGEIARATVVGFDEN